MTREVIRIRDGGRQTVHDAVAEEEPLEIRVDGDAVAVTMRTPGHDDELAAGFLVGEGVLDDADAIADIRLRPGIADIRLRPGTPLDRERLRRNVYVASSCGVCGKASIDAVRIRARAAHRKGAPHISGAVLARLSATLRAAQPDFDRTGGLHAAGLFTPDGSLTDLREDVGRHNAVDKVVGRALLNRRLPLDTHLLLVSGRASFELVQKATLAGIPILAAIGAPSSLAIDLAEDTDTTLIGFLRDDRYNLYSGAWRVVPESLPHEP